MAGSGPTEWWIATPSTDNFRSPRPNVGPASTSRTVTSSLRAYRNKQGGPAQPAAPHPDRDRDSQPVPSSPALPSTSSPASPLDTTADDSVRRSARKRKQSEEWWVIQPFDTNEPVSRTPGRVPALPFKRRQVQGPGKGERRSTFLPTPSQRQAGESAGSPWHTPLQRDSQGGGRRASVAVLSSRPTQGSFYDLVFSQQRAQTSVRLRSPSPPRDHEEEEVMVVDEGAPLRNVDATSPPQQQQQVGGETKEEQRPLALEPAQAKDQQPEATAAPAARPSSPDASSGSRTSSRATEWEIQMAFSPPASPLRPFPHVPAPTNGAPAQQPQRDFEPRPEVSASPLLVAPFACPAPRALPSSPPRNLSLHGPPELTPESASASPSYKEPTAAGALEDSMSKKHAGVTPAPGHLPGAKRTAFVAPAPAHALPEEPAAAAAPVPTAPVAAAPSTAPPVDPWEVDDEPFIHLTPTEALRCIDDICGFDEGPAPAFRETSSLCKVLDFDDISPTVPLAADPSLAPAPVEARATLPAPVEPPELPSPLPPVPQAQGEEEPRDPACPFKLLEESPPMEGVEQPSPPFPSPPLESAALEGQSPQDPERTEGVRKAVIEALSGAHESDSDSMSEDEEEDQFSPPQPTPPQPAAPGATVGEAAVLVLQARAGQPSTATGEGLLDLSPLDEAEARPLPLALASPVKAPAEGPQEEPTAACTPPAPASLPESAPSLPPAAPSPLQDALLCSEALDSPRNDRLWILANIGREPPSASPPNPGPGPSSVGGYGSYAHEFRRPSVARSSRLMVTSSRRVTVPVAPRPYSSVVGMTEEEAARALLGEALFAESAGPSRPLVTKGLIRKKQSESRRVKSDRESAEELVRSFHLAYSNAKLASKWREGEPWAVTDAYGVEMDAERAAELDAVWNEVGSRVRTRFPEEHHQFIRRADEEWKTLRNNRTTLARRAVSKGAAPRSPVPPSSDQEAPAPTPRKAPKGILKRRCRLGASPAQENAENGDETPRRPSRAVRFGETCQTLLFSIGDSPDAVMKGGFNPVHVPLKDLDLNVIRGEPMEREDGEREEDAPVDVAPASPSAGSDLAQMIGEAAQLCLGTTLEMI